MILVSRLKQLLDECEGIGRGNFVITPVDKSVCVTEMARIQSTYCDDMYIDISSDWMDIDPERAIVYSRYTAPAANLITNYLIDNLDKWWKE